MAIFWDVALMRCIQGSEGLNFLIFKHIYKFSVLYSMKQTFLIQKFIFYDKLFKYDNKSEHDPLPLFGDFIFHSSMQETRHKCCRKNLKLRFQCVTTPISHLNLQLFIKTFCTITFYYHLLS